MNPSIRRTVAALATWSLLAAVARGDDRDEFPERRMPSIESGVKVTVRPGEQVRIRASFDCDKESCVQVFDQRDGRYVKMWGKLGGEDFVSPRNNSAETVVYLLVSRRKDVNVGSEPWRINRFKVLDSDPAHGSVLKVGWEDAADDDYNDALASVTYLPAG